MTLAVTDGELEALEAQVIAALASGDPSALNILGYGEISSVLRLDTASGPAAAKRLPPFADDAAVARYREAFERYLATLEEGGVTVAPSTLHVLPHPAGGRTVWCVQPLLDGERLGPRALAAAARAEGDDAAVAAFDQMLQPALTCVSPRCGLDGQASNWVLTDEGPRYLDVTTPMLRDDARREALDPELFLASLPWALRGLVRRFMLGGILDKYYDVRGVAVDLLGNLVKEGLSERLPALIAHTNAALGSDISEAEVRAYYRSDARMWALLQRLRRADRWWQRAVRRRPYPFLLPGRIERRV